jgi:protein gp37
VGRNSPIEWCDDTVNAQAGCDGCELWSPGRLSVDGLTVIGETKACYAGLLIDGNGARPGYAGRKGFPEAFNRPASFPERVPKASRWPGLYGTERPGKPWLNGYPRLIFFDDMGDTFTESLPLDWLQTSCVEDRSLHRWMAESAHIWQWLTKRPKRLLRYVERFGAAPNFWLGTSITAETNLKPRATALRQVKRATGCMTYLSAEPLHTEVDLRPYLGRSEGVDWVIVGGGSGPNEQPCPLARIEAVVTQCAEAQVPVFVKQLGGHPNKRGGMQAVVFGRTWHEMPPVTDAHLPLPYRTL